MDILKHTWNDLVSDFVLKNPLLPTGRWKFPQFPLLTCSYKYHTILISFKTIPQDILNTNIESSSCGTMSRPLSKFGPIAKSIPIFGFCSDASHLYWSFHIKQIWSQNLECCASLAYVSIQPISLVKFHY